MVLINSSHKLGESILLRILLSVGESLRSLLHSLLVDEDCSPHGVHLSKHLASIPSASLRLIELSLELLQLRLL